jgi:hypothetical protein
MLGIVIKKFWHGAQHSLTRPEDSLAKPEAEDFGAGSGTVAGVPPQVKYRCPDRDAWRHWTIEPARFDESLFFTFFVNRRSVSDPEFGSTQNLLVLKCCWF